MFAVLFLKCDERRKICDKFTAFVFFLRPHQIKNPVTGREAAISAARK